MTKTELKAQRDALKQFTRFLPTLQLKKTAVAGGNAPQSGPAPGK